MIVSLIFSIFISSIILIILSVDLLITKNFSLSKSEPEYKLSKKTSLFSNISFSSNIFTL